MAHELRSSSVNGRRLRVVMVCGQVRPHDLARLRARYPGLLDTAGNSEVDAIVATQTLEVGADLDLAGMVTELAGGSALVQRAGRVNRLGRRDSGPVTVVVPTVPIKDGQRSGPYGADELADSWAWLEKRALDPGGLAPWALRGHAPPPAPPRRTLYQRPELAEAAHWARTSDALAAEPELDLWLAEDLATLSDLSLGLVVREAMPFDDAEACALIGALRPQRHETFPVPFLAARDALARAHGESVEDSGTPGLRALIYRGGDVGVLTWTRRDDGGWRPDDLRPGDVVVVDASVALFTAVSDESPQVLVPAGSDTPRHAAPDVLEELPRDADGRPVEPGPGQVVHRIELDLPESDHESEDQRDRRRLRARLRDDLAALRRDDQADDDARDVRSIVAAWLDQHGETSMAGAAAGLLLSPERAVDVEPQGDEEAPTRVVVVDRRRAVADEDIRQEWTSSTGDEHQSAPPTLDAHQRDVGERAAAIGVHAGLSAELVDVLRDAGLHHDDGKIDTRFQTRLGNSTAQPRAKGYAASPLAAKRREQRAGLPPGWRHEQRSVCDAWPSLIDSADRDLVARLVGTSHGQGRSGFPHAAGELLDEPDDLARDLFDHGGWDALVERTHRRYGVWGCAYLESLLRAADGQNLRGGAMSIFTLTGDQRVLLTHAALYGLVTILEDAGIEDLLVAWKGGAAELAAPHLDAETVDDAVRRHAAEHATADSWMTRTVEVDGTVRGRMSPRLSTFKSQRTWRHVQAERHDVLDELTASRAWLDLELLDALGEPCYWSRNRKGETLQDDGASRFEMQPRNRGSEIVTNRLRPLATFVANRAPGRTASGLTGALLVDDLGKDSPDSSTATGLRMPGPVDSAVAWCAMWGISALARAPRVNAPAATSGHLGRSRREWFYAPVWSVPWRPARLRTVLASRQLAIAATDGLAPLSPGAAQIGSAGAWLRARGLRGIIRFPIERFGSDNAPERRAMYGEPIPLPGRS